MPPIITKGYMKNKNIDKHPPDWQIISHVYGNMPNIMVIANINAMNTSERQITRATAVRKTGRQRKIFITKRRISPQQPSPPTPWKH